MASCIAAQLYTLRNFTKTPADIATTLKKVRAIGYEAVQLSALGPIPTDDLKAILDKEGLTVAATHASYEKMRDDPEAILKEHRTLGCKHTAIGGLPTDYRNAAGYPKFAKEASAVAKRLTEGGLSWGYHNHAFELEKFSGRTGLEILYGESDPAYFTAEIDTYWITYGGGDPAHWIRSLKGRIPLLHLKDMSFGADKQWMAEVGEGNLNWPAILDAAKFAGVKWYIVEQDVCQRDEFESLAISLKNLKKMGLQ